MVRRLQLGNFDAPGALAWATITRVATWSTTPGFCGVELLWQWAKCITPDGNSGPSPPDGNPTTDAIHAIELLKNKTIAPDGYEKRDSELRTLIQLPDNYTKLTPMTKTEALCWSGAPRRRIHGYKLNIMSSVQGSIRSVESGVRKYPPLLRNGRLYGLPALDGGRPPVEYYL